MEKSLVKAINWLILVFSFIMFFYQVQIAVNQLRNPPIIDSTEILNIADVDPPLITVCPLNQFNKTKMKEFGYRNLNSVLSGYSYKNKQGPNFLKELSSGGEAVGISQDIDLLYSQTYFKNNVYPRMYLF